jgi:hypothetical protein
MSRKGVRGKEEAQASFPRSRPFFCGGVGAVFFRPKEKRPYNSHLCYDEIVHITRRARSRGHAHPDAAPARSCPA